MQLSFYSAALGAAAQQDRLDVTANNIANMRTTGYKASRTSFSELIYQNINAAESETPSPNMRSGSGVKVSKTTTNFKPGNITKTGEPTDYAIQGEGFFASLNPATGEIKYTRSGAFRLSEFEGEFRLADVNGNFVLDPNFQPITVEDANAYQNIGVFKFDVTTDALRHDGYNNFIPTEKSGDAAPIETTRENLKQGFLEDSGVSYEDEITELIRAQRMYQYSLRMLQASDEVEQTINSLRG